jgi:hypothetical protein
MRGSDAFESMMSKKMTLLKIVWTALTGSIFLYGIVGYAIAIAGPPAETGDTFRIIRYAMYFIGVLTGLLALGLKGFLFSRERVQAALEAPLDLQFLARDRTGQVNRNHLDNLRKMPENEQRLLGLTNWYLARYIAVLALNESVAIYGFVLAMVSHRPGEMLPFLAAALFLNAMMFAHPRNLLEGLR